MPLPLACECGGQVLVTEGMAGTSVTCPCGRTVRVPTLGQLRRWAAEHDPYGDRPSVRLPEGERMPAAVWIAYALAVGWLCLPGLPLLILCLQAGRPVPAAGVLLQVAGQVWLFSQVFMGNPVAALIIILVPFVGPLLALKFVIDHWAIARWPFLLNTAGTVMVMLGMVGIHQW